jgi:hypothetical protein
LNANLTSEIGIVKINLLDILYASKPSWLVLDPKKVGDLTYRNSGTLARCDESFCLFVCLFFDLSLSFPDFVLTCRHVVVHWRAARAAA